MKEKVKANVKGKVKDCLKSIKRWLLEINNHIEIEVTSGYFYGMKGIIIAEYKDVSLIEFYNSNQTRIYLDNFRFVKIGKSKIR